MKQLIFIITSIFFVQINVFAIDYSLGNAASISLAKTGATNKSVSAIFTNQAGLANIKKTQFFIGTSRNFLLPDLTQTNAGIAIPAKYGVFGIGIQRFGFMDYNETELGIGYSKKLSNQFSLGIQLDVLQQHIVDEKDARAYTFEIGLQSVLTKNITIGFHAFNPYAINSNEYQKSIPSIFKLGLQYQASKKAIVFTEAYQNLNTSFNFKTALEYKLITPLALRIGIQTNPRTMSVGIGYCYKKISIDFGNEIHQQLGLSPHFSFTYNLDK